MAHGAGLKKILVVDDERAMAHALELKLHRSGFVPSLAADGEEALKTLDKDKFSLILLDLMMPKIDGFGVLEAMKKSGNRTPVVVLTNLSQSEDENRAMKLGAKAYFVKTDTPIAAVISAIEKFV